MRGISQWIFISIGVVGLAIGLVIQAKAATPYQGLYVVMDPYAPLDVANMQSAAETPCVAGQPSNATPFCTAADGILLRIPWCDFQLYHLTIAHGKALPSCHYTVSYANGIFGSHGVQNPSADIVSPCSGSYDTCSGRSHSTLATALTYIAQISQQRARVGLPPIKLSIGLFAGIGTPQSIFDTLGSVDVVHTTDASLNPNTFECYRLPIPWKAQFLASYSQALGQLLSYILAQMPQGANITIVKAAAITATDLEIEEPGQPVAETAPSDPGPATRGPLLKCNNKIPGAQTWLNLYNAGPVGTYNLAEANESAFGTMIGDVASKLSQFGLSTSLLSIPTTDGSAFPYVNCGFAGTTGCTVSANEGPYSTYYFETYAYDLFHGGLSETTAATAYMQATGSVFALTPAQFSVNSTDMAPAIPTGNSTQYIPCVINKTVPAYALIDNFGAASEPVLGVGAVIGWQTQVNQGLSCASGGYKKTLDNGLADGSLFIEVETDAAFTYLKKCSPYLTNTLSALLAATPPASCTY